MLANAARTRASLSAANRAARADTTATSADGSTATSVDAGPATTATSVDGSTATSVDGAPATTAASAGAGTATSVDDAGTAISVDVVVCASSGVRWSLSWSGSRSVPADSEPVASPAESAPVGSSAVSLISANASPISPGRSWGSVHNGSRSSPVPFSPCRMSSAASTAADRSSTSAAFSLSREYFRLARIEAFPAIFVPLMATTPNLPIPAFTQITSTCPNIQRRLMDLTEPGDHRVIGYVPAAGHHVRHVRGAGPFDAAGGQLPMHVGVDQHRHQHVRVVPSPADSTPLGHLVQRGQVQLLHDVQHEPHPMPRRQPIPQTGRQQKNLLTINGSISLGHQHIIPETAGQSTCDSHIREAPKSNRLCSTGRAQETRVKLAGPASRPGIAAGWSGRVE